MNTTILRVKLFRKYALPLLTEKQSKNWHNKDWNKISKKKSYHKALELIDTEVEAALDDYYKLQDELCDHVKKEVPEGFKFTCEFYTSSFAGFYRCVGEYPVGGRNCVNCMIIPDTRQYQVYGTDGYSVGELLGYCDTAEAAARLANAWLGV